MPIEQAMEIMHEGLVVLMKISAPILLLSMFVGLLISIFQAATQINEQTITFVPKLFFIGIVLFSAGGWMMEVMKDFFLYLFEMMVRI